MSLFGVRRRLHNLLRPKVFTGIFLAMGAVILAVCFYRYNQTPAVGTVQKVTPEPQVAAAASARFSGKAIAFDYSTDYRTVENMEGSPPPVTEQYSLGKHNPAHGSTRIGITVKDLSNPMLEDSAYAFRRNEATQYEASDEATPDRTLKKMSKKDGTEITYFIPSPPDRKAYAIVSATSTNPDETFKEEAAQLVRSFVWR